MAPNFFKFPPPCATCGHAAADHHTSWFPGGAVLIEECEYWPTGSSDPCWCDKYTRAA
jgi:hypothetical protein